MVKALQKGDPKLLQFAEELPSLEAATKVSLQQISADMSALQSGFSNISNSLETVFKEEKSKFVDQISTFIKKAKEELESIKTKFKPMEQKYKEAVSFFGEDPKTSQPEDFFGLIFRFANAIQETIAVNQRMAEDEEKNRKREEARKKRVRS